MIGKLISIARNIIPARLLNIIRVALHSKFMKSFYFHEKYLIRTSIKKHQKALEKLKGKDKIKVVFFVLQYCIWKYEELYKLMDKDDKFEPLIVICPYIIFGEEVMQNEMRTAYNLFKKKNYNVVNTYNTETYEWLDVKKEIKPDIIFFSTPFRYSKDKYFITNYSDYLTCYVPYAYSISHLNQLSYNQLFHNLLWKVFYETSIHKKISAQYARNNSRNVVITGHPGIDVFLNKNYVAKDVWKIKNKKLKRIIWAPHHTIDENKSFLSFSNFLSYHQLFLDIAHKHENNIQIAFKPHPLLKLKLYKHKDWGKKKTDLYYNKWNDLPNGQLEEYGYIDLFLTSDALIHDSGSFMTEYLYTKKTELFMVRDANLRKRLNTFGNMVLDQLYKANNENDIVAFVENIILKGDDCKKEAREVFFNKYLLPPKTGNASFNILNEIKEELHKLK